MPIGSSKDAFSSTLFTESVMMESRPHSNSSTAWSKKVYLITLFKWQVNQTDTKSPYCITRFNAHNRYGVEHIIRCNETGKQDPSTQCKEDGRIGQLSAELQDPVPFRLSLPDVVITMDAMPCHWDFSFSGYWITLTLQQNPARFYAPYMNYSKLTQ